MKELEILVEDLKEYLKTREAELRKSSNFNLYTEGFIINRKSDIESFEASSKSYEKNPLHKSEVIAGFTKDADLIKKEIDKISN